MLVKYNIWYIALCPGSHCVCCMHCSAACESDQYECRSGECIPEAYYCDDNNDCADNSDEEFCPLNRHNCELFSTNNYVNTYLCHNVKIICMFYRVAN